MKKAKARKRRIKSTIGSGCRREEIQRGAISSPHTRLERAVKRGKEGLGTGW